MAQSLVTQPTPVRRSQRNPCCPSSVRQTIWGAAAFFMHSFRRGVAEAGTPSPTGRCCRSGPPRPWGLASPVTCQHCISIAYRMLSSVSEAEDRLGVRGEAGAQVTDELPSLPEVLAWRQHFLNKHPHDQSLLIQCLSLRP
jgi:hypothetical protein